MTYVRVQRTAGVKLTRTFYVDETATDSSGTVEVEVRRLDGTLVDSGNATDVGVGVYEYLVPGQPELDILTVDWSPEFLGETVTVRDYVEVVGGFLFGLSEARNMKPKLDETQYPTAMLADKRIEVEVECEQITGRSFVPRFGRSVVDGSGNEALVLPVYDIRKIRSITVADSAGIYTALTVPQLAYVQPSASGVFYRRDGLAWSFGYSNVIVEYEYGLDFPPANVADMAKLRLRSLLNPANSGVPARAMSFTVTDGGVYRLSIPGADRTGIPDVDAVYQRAGHSKVWLA